LVVVLALLLPNNASGLSVVAFVSIPLELVLAAVFLLLVPFRVRPVLAVALGAALGLLTVVKVVDMGFHAVLARPFDPVLDWVLIDDAVAFLGSAIGTVGALGATLGAVLLLAAVVLLVTWSVWRLHRAVLTRSSTIAAVVVLAATWVTCAALGVQFILGVPFASAGSTALVHSRLTQAGEGLRDRQTFAAEAELDAFRDSSGAQLLTGLRGKDVVVAFVESYGRTAIEDAEFAPQVGAVLDDGDRRLLEAGFSSRSAFLTSSTAGGGSWLAHSTVQSGLWIDNQQRYRNLVAGQRLTLTDAFGRAGWRTVGVMPGTTSAWPEGGFFGYDRVYASGDLGYRGPRFNWAGVPDQFTLEAFQRLERAQPRRLPVMAEIQLVSSHAPWEPIPTLVGWRDLGDGSVFGGLAPSSQEPVVILTRDPARVRADYRRSIKYSLNSLISYVVTYGDDDLVLVFLGDHQPSPIVTGAGATRDVPVTLVTRDKEVLSRASSWGWQEGLKPSPNAPVWRMDAFRDRFLVAFGQ
jgi:hypothetical protein